MYCIEKWGGIGLLGASLAERVRLAVRLCKVRRGRRTAARGVSAPAGGLSSGDAPPIFFSILWKRKRAVHGPKEKTALVATLHMRAKLLCEGRRIGACSDLALPSGTLGPSVRSVLPSRGGGCGGRRGARTHLTSFSFRAFRFATRCPGGRRGCCIALCRSLHQLPASGSENRRSMYP